MKYVGSKNSMAKELLPIITKHLKKGQCYYEPFVGGANLIDKVVGDRIGSDSNKYLIALLNKLQDGWIPEFISNEKYQDIKTNKDKYPDHLVGWVGINCSYSGKWFGGYAGITKTRNGERNYQDEALRNILKQKKNLDGIEFVCGDYRNVVIPQNSIIYCDPPYEGTLKYIEDFDHDAFWDWCREMSRNGHLLYISEYNAPDDFSCIYEKTKKSSLSANGSIGGSKKSIEKLFTYGEIK